MLKAINHIEEIQEYLEENSENLNQGSYETLLCLSDQLATLNELIMYLAQGQDVYEAIQILTDRYAEEFNTIKEG